MYCPILNPASPVARLFSKDAQVPPDLASFYDDVEGMKALHELHHEILSSDRSYEIPVKVPDPDGKREPFDATLTKVYLPAPGGGTEIHMLTTLEVTDFSIENGMTTFLNADPMKNWMSQVRDVKTVEEKGWAGFLFWMSA